MLIAACLASLAVGIIIGAAGFAVILTWPPRF